MKIGILSTDGDMTTEDVIDWLTYFNVESVRFNEEDLSQDCSVGIDNTNSIQLILKSSYTINTSDVSYFWNRKWGAKELLNITNYENCSYEVLTNLNEELTTTSSFILEHLNSMNKIFGFFPKISSNKLHQLSIAKSCNLKIPKSTITNQIEYNTETPIVTKPITNPISIYKGKRAFTTYTSLVNKDECSDSFFPSLLQEKIEKQYEIRTFFIENSLFSMAILSQGTKSGQIDFRRKDKNKELRTLPYQLPKDIEIKLVKLMDKLQLKTGSIDIVKSINNEYVFLEVNPNGQFGMVSEPCNYYLEKEVAAYLIKKSND